MKEQRLQTIVMAFCCILVLLSKSSAATARDAQVGFRIEQLKQTLKNAQLSRDTKDEKWYVNLPPFIYNMCALYYVVPDCLSEVFGEDFDVSSMLEEICPS